MATDKYPRLFWGQMEAVKYLGGQSHSKLTFSFYLVCFSNNLHERQTGDGYEFQRVYF